MAKHEEKSTVIKNLGESIDRLVARSGELARENEKLAGVNRRLRDDNTMLKGRIVELEKRISTLELRGALSGESDDPRRAQLRINQLMREVDKCIAMLDH
ncbi:MAG: hypothetical protein LBH06_00050 [Rikenellaceae bacterium]|jgi:hypothetical protein|nr:hypothetical protein [Rikenellaceae bacterium]